jgi:signal transduction histidine kinase
MVKEKAMQHGIKLSNNINGIPDTITADERKLKQIMYNLLSNAVKFTPDGGEVSLTAQTCGLEDVQLSAVDSDQNCGIKINVSDTGIGLNPEDLDRIFNSFEQVEHSKSRKFQGSGLGLSLTKRLVELHGGRIWADSEGEGKGSTFSFIIPATPTDISFNSETDNQDGK